MSPAFMARISIGWFLCLIWLQSLHAIGHHFTMLDGYKVNNVLEQSSVRSITECSVKVLISLAAHHKYHSATYDHLEKICGVSDVMATDGMTYTGNSNVVTLLSRHARSCADVALLYQHTTNGEYIIRTTDGSDITVFCQFDGQAGYTFLSRLDINNQDMAALYTDPSRGVLLRHLGSNGSQSDVHLQQTAYWENRANITIETSLNEIIVTFAAFDQNVVGVFNGVTVNGVDYGYLNCDGNPLSILETSFLNLWSSTDTLIDNKGIGEAIYNVSAAASVTLPHRYFAGTLIHFGGCGALANNDHFSVNGTAIGIPFKIE